jgi:hypothetical protein
MVKLLSNLSSAEYNEFLSGVKVGTNSYKIARLLRSTPDLTKDEIFKRVFKQKRTQSNDHLLRNELSILKRKLEDFIVGNSTLDLPEVNVYYAAYALGHWCIKNGLVELASKYCSKAEELARDVDSSRGLIQINKLKLQIIQYSKSDYHLKLTLLEELRANHLQQIHQLVSEEMAFADFISAGAYKLASNLRKTEKLYKSTKNVEIDLENPKSRIAQYYYHKSLGYSQQGKEAILQLNKALVVLQEENEIYNQDAERLTCLSAIAMEYALLGELKRSADTYRSIIINPGFQSFTARNSLLFNYCTTLIKLKQYKEALIHIEELEKEELEPIVKERIYTMKCNCYIFLEDVKKLKSILPQKLQSFDLSVRAYYRFLFTIYYLIKDEDDLAERELTNIKNMKGFSETDYSPLLKLFEKYVETYTAKKYKEKQYVQHLKQLNIQIDLLHQQHKEISELLPVMWIEQKIEEINKIK